MRIQVQFGDTQVLVPCGDGKITVSELIEKAIVRYRKVTNRDPDDVIEVESVHLADENRTYVDQDDEVAESLEDKETIVVIFHDSSHDQYPNDGPLSTNSISDDSAIVDASQPFSHSNLGDNDHTPFVSDLQIPLGDNVLASITEDEIEYVPHDEGQPGGPHHGSQDLHMASQDIDLVTAAWHGTSQHSSSHSQDPHSQDPNSHSDSGFAPDPTRSQESFPLKSQESFGPKSQDAVFPPDLGYSTSGTPPGGTGSQNNLSTPRSNLKKDDHKVGFGSSPPTPQKTNGTPTRNPHAHHMGPGSTYPVSRGKGMDIPYGNRPGGYNFPPGFHPAGPYHDPKRLPGVMDESSPYDNGPRLAHLEWRRAYPGGPGGGGEFPYHHDMPPLYGSLPPGGLMPHDHYHHRGGSGRFSRPPEALMGHYPPKGKDARITRAMSHERVDQLGPSSFMMGQGGHPGFGHEDYSGPIEYHLSQPSPYYDRPGGMFPMPPAGAGPHPHMMGYDPRFAMAGPSGYSLSQPGMMMSHGGRGMYEYTRPFPGGRGRGKGDGSWGERHPPAPGRPQSIDEELDCFNEEEEDNEREREKGYPRPSPFQRDFRKSVFRDGSVYSAWMDRVQEYGIQESEETNELPEFEGDTSQSQRSRTPSPAPAAGDGDHRVDGVAGDGGDGGEGTEGSEDEGEDSEYGNIHIVELHKGEESLGIILTHYTSPNGVDLGVFIGAMDENGFAFKSGKLQYNDRVLACNGVDFTKEHTTQQVKDIFYQMAQEPLLRMAISRGVSIPEAYENKPPSASGDGHVTSSEEREIRDGERREEERAAIGRTVDSSVGAGPMSTSASTSVGGASISVGGVSESGTTRGEGTPDPPRSPRILPSANQSTPITLANTRQIGVKRTIELTKGASGLGIGLTSRDVLTDNKSHPVYIKSIQPKGAAFQDGRLKLGDRLLSVNGEDIQGMRRPEVVQLLRDAEGKVTLVVSRQEAVEEQEPDTVHFSPQHSQSANLPETINKTVLTFDISLYNSTAAWLGITVYGKSSTAKKAGDMGIYIKSITPGGAAAMDGRLQKNDQILYVNRQNLTGKSNQEALDILRKALSSANDSDSKIRLVVARTISSVAGSARSTMAVLGEKPEEEEREGEWYIEGTSQEVGIDVPSEKPPSAQSNVIATSSASVGGTTNSSLGPSQSLQQNLRPTKSTSLHSLNSQSSSPHNSTTRLSTQTSLEQEQPSRGSMRGRAATMATNSLPRGNRGRSPGAKMMDYQRSASPLLNAIGLARADDGMGSGEFDRLEPLNKVGPAHSPTQSPHLPPTLRQNSVEALYEHAAASVSHYNTLPTPTNHYDNHHGYGYSPYDHMTDSSERENKFTSLPADFNQTPPTITRHRPPLMSRDFSASPSRHRSPISPPPMGYSDYPSYPSNHSSRNNSLKRNRELSPFSSYDRHGNSMYSPYSSDTGSTASGTAYIVGVSSAGDGSQLVPTRGSSRRTDRDRERDRERDRNRPERGSSRSHHTRSSSAHLNSATSFLSDTIPDGVSTLPRAMSRSSDRQGSNTGRSTTPTNPESSSLCSLDELRLEESESNSAFRRDDAGRISITKKTKKNPRQDLAHLQFGNTEPLVEGENSMLVRTGSDGCLNHHNSSNDDTLPNGIEVGPHLGLFKSSSLESLHNVMQHAIKRDIVDDGSDLRNRSTRNSFRKAVDRTIDGQGGTQGEMGEQRVVDVNFDLETSTASPAMISYTKKPKKKGFSLKKVFKRKGSKKEKSPKSRKTQSMHIDLESIQHSLTPAEQEFLCRYKVNVQEHPELHSQESVPVSLGAIGPGYGGASLDDYDIDDDDQPILVSDLQPQRHSMAVVEEYESPSSPDEILLSTMAKV